VRHEHDGAVRLAALLVDQGADALLVLALLITPAAAAMRVTSSPRLVVMLSIVFAMTATVGGILLALGGRLPISPYVTTLSFLIYVACRMIGNAKAKRGLNGRVVRNAAAAA
jgi:zinc/manganese transport system permease protein